MTKTLEELLAAVKDYKMSPEEREAQRMSWVIGEMMLADLSLTREEAIRRYKEACK